MCIITFEGNKAVMDCVRCSLGLGSSTCLNSHLKAIAGLEKRPKTHRYEEEVLVELNEKQTNILNEYISLIREIEKIIIKQDIYGIKEDDNFYYRKEIIRKFYEEMFMDPLISLRTLEEYKEEYPKRQMFIKDHQKFMNWKDEMSMNIKKTKLYILCKEKEGLQNAFMSLTNLNTFEYLSTSNMPIPENAKKIDSYDLDFGIKVEIYDILGKEEKLYVQSNLRIEKLDKTLKKILNKKITSRLKEFAIEGDLRTIHEEKLREFRIEFMDESMIEGKTITNEEATAMGRETANWLIGLGGPIENISLDKEITDIYIDSQNSPIYIEHQKYGVCHTLWRYNEEMLEKAFLNVIFESGHSRKFDKNNPVIDVVLPRLNMRCHLQRPPATFGDLQAALRLMRNQPFTYPLYLDYKSLTPFFAGYDDFMVSVGSSEAVMGLKASGKTSFISAKISAIGTKRRILPIQDIEEIPVAAYRKRGFHIGAIRVQSSEKEEMSKTELDLVTMANVSLRMGDACVIINEIRSRLAIQGVINLLNTQPGVFLLYNLHAESLQDVQDRLELVFGMPSASMFSTDRYTILKKARFGRQSRIYRIIGEQYEVDPIKHKFIEVFSFNKEDSIEECKLKCNFIGNPEASAWDLKDLDLIKLEKNLKIIFVPPTLARRSEESGLSIEQCIMQAFFKGKMYFDIYNMSKKYNDPQLLEIDFVLKINALANNLLKNNENKKGEVDYSKLVPLWEKEFDRLIKEDINSRKIE
ncbi:MAG: ATPase, T2SS/T4P/T4SS family [Candidatus Micrarchaeia archaeon]|jgi:type IV secretory pathway ATPase VirB11/archaellum biosynthesis ATPase